MTGFPWWTWIILAGVLALAEMAVPSSYLMWIAVGAAVTAIAAVTTGMVFEGQLAVFTTATALSCVAGYFVYRAMESDRDGEVALNAPRRSMIGARGTVSQAFVNGRGKVRIGDTVWLANGPDLAEGTPVVVAGLRGTRLEVTGQLEAGADSTPAVGGA
ncbi:MAG TPA: NfeD family protein [Stellaceae bacterium]|nr:NfeD family protein [Stellaceae bacterium]